MISTNNPLNNRERGRKKPMRNNCRAIYVVLQILTVLLFAAEGNSATVLWVNPNGGNWGEGSNWSTGTSPAPGDDVQINLSGNYTVNMDCSTGVKSLIIGAGTLSQGGSLNGNTLTLNDRIPPAAANDSATTNSGSPVTINVLANDTDADGSIDPSTCAVATGPSHGTAAANADGTITYTSTAGYTGTDTFTYTVKDNSGATSNAATVTVTVKPVNIPPVAANDSATTNSGLPVAVDVLANDTDADGTIDPATCAVTTAPSHGSAVANADGTITYTPNSNYTGNDTFKYSVKDNGGATSNEATVTLTVTAIPLNSPPVAVNDTAQTITNTPVSINVASNDTDADGTLDLTTCVVTASPAHGTAVEQGNCTVLYTPTTGYNGADTFTYTVKDNDGAVSNTATVQVLVNSSQNAAPRASNDSADTTVNTPVTINVIANDTDSDGTIDPATCTIMSGPSNGTAVAQSNGTVLYTPNSGYNRKDTFTYTVKDNLGRVSNAATVTVTVGIVIDNGLSSNFLHRIMAGFRSDPDTYGANSVYGRNGATYTWTFTPAVSGNYEISMWWTYATSRSDNIPVDIPHFGGTDTYFINQQANAGKWNTLGTYPFVAGQSYNIKITSQPNPTSTCADAVRFVNVPGNVAPVATINSVSPNPSTPGQSVAFSGSGARS